MKKFIYHIAALIGSGALIAGALVLAKKKGYLKKVKCHFCKE